MKRFISLLTFTDHGLRHIQDSPSRADAFLAEAEASGIKINALYWTIGGYDGVISFDAPDAETAAGVMLKLSSLGNLKAHTLQAFPRESISAILGSS